MSRVLPCGATIATTGDQPGDLIAQNGQVEFNGLLMGDNTPFIIQSLQGWDDQPTMDDASTSRPNADGAWPGRLLAQPRTVQFTDGQVQASADQMRDAIAVARQYLQRTDDERPLVARFGDQSLRVDGRVVRRSIPVVDRILGHESLAVQWKCTDPLRYGVTEKNALLTQPYATGGLQYPLQYPLDYGDYEGGSALVTNDGDEPAPVRVVFRGPARGGHVRFKNGQVLSHSMDLASLQTLTIDTSDGHAELDGEYIQVAQVLGRYSVPPASWRIPRGTTEVYFDTPNNAYIAGGYTNCNLYYRDTYL